MKYVVEITGVSVPEKGSCIGTELAAILRLLAGKVDAETSVGCLERDLYDASGKLVGRASVDYDY